MDPFGFCGEPVGIYFGVKNECVQVCAMAFAIECRLGVCICRISFFGFAFGICDEYGIVVGDACKGETIFFTLAKFFQFVFLGQGIVLAASEFVDGQIIVVIERNLHGGALRRLEFAVFCPECHGSAANGNHAFDFIQWGVVRGIGRHAACI